MKKLQKIFDASLKNYADTREFDFKKAVYDNLKENDDLHNLKVLFFDAKQQLNKIFIANNPHGDSLSFKRFDIFIRDPEFLNITNIDQMMNYLSEHADYPIWYDSIKKNKDEFLNYHPDIYKKYVESTGLSPYFTDEMGYQQQTEQFKIFAEQFEYL